MSRTIVVNGLPPGSQARLGNDQWVQTALAADGKATLTVPDSIGDQSLRPRLFIEAAGKEAVAVPGFTWYNTDITVPPSPQDDWWVTPIPDPASSGYPTRYLLPLLQRDSYWYPPSSGTSAGGLLLPLHVAGHDFVDASGARYTVIGSTELMLAQVFDAKGADAIRPTLTDRQALGFNNLRVLWQKDMGNTGHSPWLMPVEKLRPFLSLCAEYGFYVQGTILADCQVVNPNEAEQRLRVESVRAATVGIANHIEQLGNEYDKNGHDPSHFSKPGDRLAANSSSTEGGKDAPYWDFFCFSGSRSPVQKAIREYGPIEFLFGNGAGWGGVPGVCDEGMKPGVNSSEPRDFERAGSQARSGVGGRLHTLTGTSYESGPFNPLERACAAAFVHGLRG